MNTKNEIENTYQLLIEEYKNKRDKKEIECRNRQEKYFSIYNDLKEVCNELLKKRVEFAKESIFSKDINHSNEKYETKINQLIETRNYLLKKYNIKDFYPLYECEKCLDTGFINGHKCTCLLDREKKYVVENNIDDSNNILIYQDEFDISLYDQKNVRVPSGEKYYDYIVDFIRTTNEKLKKIDKEAFNLYLAGDVGTGKTFLSKVFLRKALENNIQSIFITINDLVNIFFDKEKEQKLLKICKTQFLIIDDLGTESTSFYSNSNLFSIIDKRLNYKKSTIITSNLSYEDLETYYSERIASRIANKYKYHRLYGNDLRKEL
ncbi:MAG: ATP-binding protein [Eubacteriales bacterium]|nr:ATP-binding protein [Eubacteriales bacterium]